MPVCKCVSTCRRRHQRAGVGPREKVKMDPAIRLLRDLVAINSINPTLVPGAPGEAAIAAAVAAEMRRIGLDVETEIVADGRPNTIGVLEGRAKGRSLVFCGHLDTVGVIGMKEPFTPLEREGRL